MHLAPTSNVSTSFVSRAARGLAAALALAVTLGAQAARANDLSDYPCTAGDVEVVGSGVVINEPCDCSAGNTFSATVQFTVRNNTSTGRYCISLHLVPDGVVLTQPLDVILRDANNKSTAPGKSGGEKYHDTVMFGTIPNFPCNQGVVCFGQAGVVRGKCSVGTCTTISWNTSPGNADCTVSDQNPPGGQCRHQQICVVGFGATLACTANCTTACGASSTLQACVSAPMERGPFTLELTGNDGSSATQSLVGDASGVACVNFTVHPTKSPTTTYTLKVTDRKGCPRIATASVTVTPTTATITPPSNPGCNGVLVYTASVSGQTGCSFTWTVDGASLASFLAPGSPPDDARIARVKGTGNNTFEFRALDNACHSIEVSASCSNGTQTPCVATASTSAKQCVNATQSCK